MTTYNTEQKTELLRFLKKHQNKSFTIDEIATEMKGDSTIAVPPGKSTLYRLIPKLVDDNMVKQFSEGKGRKNVYQITGEKECSHHMHLKCVTCGKILHMDTLISDELSKRIADHAQFMVSAGKTTIFGICKDCQ